MSNVPHGYEPTEARHWFLTEMPEAKGITEVEPLYVLL